MAYEAPPSKPTQRPKINVDVFINQYYGLPSSVREPFEEIDIITALNFDRRSFDLAVTLKRGTASGQGLIERLSGALRDPYLSLAEITGYREQMEKEIDLIRRYKEAILSHFGQAPYLAGIDWRIDELEHGVSVLRETEREAELLVKEAKKSTHLDRVKGIDRIGLLDLRDPEDFVARAQASSDDELVKWLSSFYEAEQKAAYNSWVAIARNSEAPAAYPKVYHPLVAPEPVTTAKPYLRLRQSLTDNRPNKWVANLADNRLEYVRHENESVRIVLPNLNQGPIPANVFSSDIEQQAWFAATREKAAELGVLESQILDILLIHFNKERERDPKTEWPWIDQRIIAKYREKDPDNFNEDNWRTQIEAFERLLSLQVAGSWQVYLEGLNQEPVNIDLSGPVIHCNRWTVRGSLDRNGQHKFPERLYAIQYNLGPHYQYTTSPYKDTDSICYPEMLALDHQNQADLYRIATSIRDDHRVHAKANGGVIRGWTIEHLFDQAGIQIPDWVYRRSQYGQYIARKQPEIERAAELNRSKLIVLEPDGTPLKDPSDWKVGLKSGKSGFEQWLKRICRVIPNTSIGTSMVIAVQQGRDKVEKRPARK